MEGVVKVDCLIKNLSWESDEKSNEKPLMNKIPLKSYLCRKQHLSLPVVLYFTKIICIDLKVDASRLT